jgi:hypothetical protein
LKRTRELAQQINEDDTLTPEQANDLTKELIQRYRLNFVKATGKRHLTQIPSSITKVAKASPPKINHYSSPQPLSLSPPSPSPPLSTSDDVKPKSESEK